MNLCDYYLLLGKKRDHLSDANFLGFVAISPNCRNELLLSDLKPVLSQPISVAEDQVFEFALGEISGVIVVAVLEFLASIVNFVNKFFLCRLVGGLFRFYRIRNRGNHVF